MITTYEGPIESCFAVAWVRLAVPWIKCEEYLVAIPYSYMVLQYLYRNYEQADVGATD
jgi:hypothetical protein